MQRIAVFMVLVYLSATISMGQSGSGARAPKEEAKPAATEPVKLSPEFKEAGTAAADAIGRVPDIHVADDGYQTRKLDAEKALDAATHKATTDEDKAMQKILVAWWALAVRQYESGPGNDFKAYQREAEAEMHCMSEANVVFKPGVLSEKGRQMAAEKKCLSEYQKIRDAGK